MLCKNHKGEGRKKIKFYSRGPRGKGEERGGREVRKGGQKEEKKRKKEGRTEGEKGRGGRNEEGKREKEERRERRKDFLSYDTYYWI